MLDTAFTTDPLSAAFRDPRLPAALGHLEGTGTVERVRREGRKAGIEMKGAMRLKTYCRQGQSI